MDIKDVKTAELVKKYNFQNFTTTCPEFVTGDGHIMAEKAGAVLKNMDFLTAYSGGLKNEENGLKKVDSIRVKDFPYIIFVNENGERFIDELGNEDGSDYDKISSSWKKAKDNKVYIMLDQAMVDSLKAEGKSIISGDKDWSKFAAQLEKGEVLFTGSTIEEVAEKAGIKAGDVIVKADGQEIKTMTELNNIKNTHNIGDTMTVTVNRNGQEKEITLTLQEQ